MSKFTTNLCINLQEDAHVWRLEHALIYESDLIGKVTVPVGFSTDLASVPRVPFIYVMWGDRAHREAVVHDYLFRIDAVPEVSFCMANKVFLEAMKCRGVSWHIRYPMYWGVMIGSVWCWRKRMVGVKMPNNDSAG